MRVLIVVTHLLGSGHLSRAATLGRAFVAAGHQVDLVSGGTPVSTVDLEGITLHQLPVVKSDGVNFTRLLDAQNDVASEAFLSDRKQVLLSILLKVRPDVLITELYPFGRRILKGEFLALLNATRSLHGKPKVYASVRDILAPPSKPEKALETEAVLAGYYDGVLVHSDQSMTPLETSWPVSEIAARKVLYTGYVAPTAPAAHPNLAGRDEVLVTAGGGDVGSPLFDAACDAASSDPDRTWRLLIGGQDRDNRISTFKQRWTAQNLIIEAARSDFRQMLNHAAVSISMCGYNTAMDVLQTGVSAVFVPFDEGGEVEQSLRAESMAKLDGIEVVSSVELSARTLLAAAGRVAKQMRRPAEPAQFCGAENAVRIVEEKLGSTHE